MNDQKSYGKYTEIHWSTELGTLKIDYGMLFPKTRKGGCDCQIKRIFHYRHEKSKSDI